MSRFEDLRQQYQDEKKLYLEGQVKIWEFAKVLLQSFLNFIECPKDRLKPIEPIGRSYQKLKIGTRKRYHLEVLFTYIDCPGDDPFAPHAMSKFFLTFVHLPPKEAGGEDRFDMLLRVAGEESHFEMSSKEAETRTELNQAIIDGVKRSMLNKFNMVKEKPDRGSEDEDEAAGEKSE